MKSVPISVFQRQEDTDRTSAVDTLSACAVQMVNKTEAGLELATM
jgi:hypothetical protein